MARKIVAVTACPTGIAHTYMAAEALEKAARAKGIEIRVETRGSIGVENALTEEEIAAADAVIVAADAKVDTARFAGKPLIEVGVGEAIKDAAGLLDRALAAAAGAASPAGTAGQAGRTASEPEIPAAAGPAAAGAAEGAHGAGERARAQGTRPDTGSAYLERVEAERAARSARRSGPYKHLMTGVSFMIPFVVAGGILIALSFVFGIEAFKQPGTLAAALMDIGGGSAFALMVPVLSGYIAYSIADRPGIAPGMVGGMLASKLGAGFLGGIVSGFLAGYLAAWLVQAIRLPRTLEGLKPVLLVPVLATGATGLLMIYVVGSPLQAVMNALTAWLQGLSGGNAVLLGLILGAMMAFDMGGPVNKAAYTFATGLLASQVYTPMAAVMAAGMTPPLGLALATWLAPRKFTREEREAGKAAAVLGISFITEGAIPFAAADPLRVIPSIMAGSAVAGALSMAFGATLRAPHGGIFVLPIPGVVGHLGLYALSILVGTVVTAAAVAVLKPEVSETAGAEAGTPAGAGRQAGAAQARAI